MARLVRCPKCTKLLVEYSEVSVYKCGGCSTILRGKNHRSTEKSVVTGSPQTSIAATPSEHDYSDTESPFSTKGTVPSSVPAQSNEEDFIGESPQLNQPDVISENGFSDKDIAMPSSSAPSMHEDHEEEDKEPIISSPRNNEEKEQHQGSAAQVAEEFALQSQDEDCEDEQIRHQKDEVTQLKSTSQSDGFEEVVVNGEQHSKSPADTTISSQIYDGSISSSEDGRRLSRHPLSRRTFKRGTTSKILQKDKEEEMSQNNKMSSLTEFEEKDKAQLSNPRNESHYSDVIRSFDAIKDKIISRYQSVELDRGRSFASTEYMSVVSWMETEEIGSKGNLHEHMELLRKLDELKAQIIDLYAERADHKQKHEPSYMKGYDSEMSFTSQTHRSYLHYQSSNSRTSSRHNHISEKSRSNERPKKHCRPVSGAAPFVICYHCMKLLQLPADFLISRTKLHKLQCGACNEILMLSFPQTTRMISETSSRVDGTTRASQSMHYPSHSIDKAPPRLLRLMGYDSATELLYPRDDFDEGIDGFDSPVMHLSRLLAT